MAVSLYQSLSVRRPHLGVPGRTEGTKTQETIDRDRDAASLDLLPVAEAVARGSSADASLYRALGDTARPGRIMGETRKTSKKETVDDDVEAVAIEVEIGGGFDSLYGWLSLPAPSAADAGRTESTRDGHETLDKDREANGLTPLLSLD